MGSAAGSRVSFYQVDVYYDEPRRSPASSALDHEVAEYCWTHETDASDRDEAVRAAIRRFHLLARLSNIQIPRRLLRVEVAQLQSRWRFDFEG